MTDWIAKPYAHHFLGGSTSGATDIEHFQFCGFPTEAFAQNLAISGSNSVRWALDTDKWVPMSQAMGGQPEFRKVLNSSLEHIMNNTALALSDYARQLSKATVTGTSGDPESYVVVKWPWLTLPAVLVALGGVLLVSTVFSSLRRKTDLWKSSVLPFLYHGLEGSILKKDEVELMSEMNRATESVIVRLDLSETDNRSILLGLAKGSSSVQWRRGRRHSL